MFTLSNLSCSGLGLDTSTHHKNILDDLMESTRDVILFENKIEIQQTNSILLLFILQQKFIFLLFNIYKNFFWQILLLLFFLNLLANNAYVI